jgi:methylated-DNA-protein-cysteine methyltransferase-like protein
MVLPGLQMLYISPSFIVCHLPMIPRNPTEAQRNFFQEVHEVVRLVPPGRVTTYGAIAHYLGARHGARMVGWAMMAAHTAADGYVPAHRVINRNGQLTGRLHFATPTAMQEALEAEGVRVIEDAVQDFKRLFWDPGTELE